MSEGWWLDLGAYSGMYGTIYYCEEHSGGQKGSVAGWFTDHDAGD